MIVLDKIRNASYCYAKDLAPSPLPKRSAFMNNKFDASKPTPRGRPRSAAARDAILQAAQALLEETGFERLTIEGVASRAGVGKATIYRWWPSRGVLAMEAFLSNVSPVIAFPQSGRASDDIAAQMKRVARAYRAKTGQIVKEMIASSQSNPEVQRIFFDGYLGPRRAAAKEALRRGIDNGEFKANADLDAVIDALYGPLFYRLLLGHMPNDDAFIDGVAEAVLEGISIANK
jgi:AcrR family transcriptional regulator